MKSFKEFLLEADTHPELFSKKSRRWEAQDPDFHPIDHAMASYTSEFSTKINSHMEKLKTNPEYAKKPKPTLNHYVDMIHRGLSQKTLKKPITVFRGISGQHGESLMKNGNYTHHSFLSASTDPQVAKDFSSGFNHDKNVVKPDSQNRTHSMEIKMSKGTHYDDMEKYKHPDFKPKTSEQELLFKPGKMKKLDHRIEGNHVIHTYEYSENND